MNELTEVRRRMLLNIQQGKEIYDGFEGSQLGGAIRSVHLWRGFWQLTSWDPKSFCLKLTDAGARALKS